RTGPCQRGVVRCATSRIRGRKAVMPRRAFSRRTFLGTVGIASAGALLAACTSPAAPTPAPAATTAPAAAATKPAAAATTAPAAATKPAAAAPAAQAPATGGNLPEVITD